MGEFEEYEPTILQLSCKDSILDKYLRQINSGVYDEPDISSLKNRAVARAGHLLDGSIEPVAKSHSDSEEI